MNNFNTVSLTFLVSNILASPILAIIVIVGFSIIIISIISHFVVICSMNEIIERIVKLSGLKRICLIASSEEEAEQMLEVA